MVLAKKEETTLSKLAKEYEMPEEFKNIASELEMMQPQAYPNYDKLYKNLADVVESAKEPYRVFKWQRQL